MTENTESIEIIIKNSQSSIISSIDENGFPNTKAMLPPRIRNGLKEFYFTTNTSSMRVEQYLASQKACIYFYDAKKYQGIMLVGLMEVLKDEKSRKMIWKPGDEMYYPLGVNDPDYCVLKFTSQSGRIYGNFKSKNIIIK
jgi:general stress protein 26